MKLVVDTNRIIAALIKDGMARAIIQSSIFEFCTLNYVLEEVKKYMAYIIKKSDLKRDEIELLFLLFMQNIAIVPDEKIKAKMPEALRIMKPIDPQDAPILACALAVSNQGIWTEDAHFDRQNKVRVWETKELLGFIKSKGVKS